MAYRVIVVIVSAGCRIGFENPSIHSGADSGLDAEADAALQFGAASAITSLNSSNEDGTFRLQLDELRGWLWSARSGERQLYEATRPSLGAAWTVVLLANVNTASAELNPTVSADGLTLVFRSNRGGGSGGNDLYQATRATTAVSFAAALQITSLNTSSSDVQPFLRGDGAELYFASNRAGTYDIYRSVRTGTTYGAPSVVAELGTPGNDEQDPALSPDGLTIYWRSDRTGGLGASDIYSATRATPTDAFGSAAHVENVNSTSDDSVSWVSADGERLYLSSDRSGTNHIYLATR